MDLNAKLNHKILLTIAGFFILAALIALFGVLIFYKNKNISKPVESQPSAEVVSTNEIQGQDAESLAQTAAKKWRTDSVLSYLVSDPMTAAGTESWKLIYVSPTLKDYGYEIVVKNKEVFSAAEVYYSGQGEDFPAETKLTQDEAIARVKNMPGYKDAEIFGINAIYGPGTKTWYWGVKTSKGVVSVEMK